VKRQSASTDNGGDEGKAGILSASLFANTDYYLLKKVAHSLWQDTADLSAFGDILLSNGFS
jgi:hypothetical protein